MDLVTLKAATRTASGKGGARAKRREGLVPATLYGGGKDAVSVAVSARELAQVIHGKGGEHAVLNLEVSDNPAASTPALIKGVQHHPVRGNVIHADFQRIRLDQKIRTSVPIQIIGRPKGVIEGGILDHQLREIEVECLPHELPEAIVLDVTSLELGQNIHVGEIPAPAGVTIVTPDHYSVAAILSSRLTRTKEAGEGGDAEGGEGAEAGA